MKLDTATEAKLKTRDFSKFLEDLPTKHQIHKWLENQNLSADAKAIIAKLVDTTIAVGGKVIAIGRKVLSSVGRLMQQFPNTSFGLVVGSALAFLIGSIPVVGWVLGPLLSPLLLAFGIGMGALNDFRSAKLEADLAIIRQEYEIFKV
jgi:hypothetical protein